MKETSEKMNVGCWYWYLEGRRKEGSGGSTEERENAGKGGGIAGSWGHRKKEDKMPPLYTLSVGKAEGEGNKILL